MAPDQSAAEALVVNQTQDGNKITIEAPTAENRRSVSFGVSQSVNFSVTLPRRVALEASTGDGGIDVSDLQGTIDLNSGDGRIVASRLDGQVKVHTGDGTIRIDQAAGKVDADSGDGSVEVTGRLDELAVRTGDGPVRVDASNGSAMKNDWRITTGDGRIACVCRAISTPRLTHRPVTAGSSGRHRHAQERRRIRTPKGRRAARFRRRNAPSSKRRRIHRCNAVMQTAKVKMQG